MPFLAAAVARRSSPALESLSLWLDATSLSQDGPVDSWASAVGGISATAPAQNNRPTFSSSGLLGRPAVVFDGENDCLAFGSLSVGSSWRAFVVCRRDGGPVNATIMSVLSGTNTQAIGAAINNDIAVGPVQLSAGSLHCKAGVFGTGAARILTLSLTSGVLGIKQGNSPASTTSISAPFAVSGSQSLIGAANSTAPTRFFCGAISEIRIYTALTSDQEQSIYAELASKWGIA